MTSLKVSFNQQIVHAKINPFFQPGQEDFFFSVSVLSCTLLPGKQTMPATFCPKNVKVSMN